MKRQIDTCLLAWKENPHRKVLIVRGARQVGKTYSVQNLGKSFEYFLEINFEQNQEINTFFKGNLNPEEISAKLALYYSIPVIPGRTLLFFDEIQACPEALRSLRFFYEKMPALHVVAAGSLLEFAISELASFGVGRLEYCYLYPLSFIEFLEAVKGETWKKIILEASPQAPVDTVFHSSLLALLKNYLMLGGMPEVITTYVRTGDITLCQKIIDDLVVTFYDDFAKYKARIPLSKLKETFTSVVFQAGGKFMYTHIAEEKTAVYKQCLELLVEAGLVYKIYHSAAAVLPLGAQIDDKKFKAVLFDVGIFQRILGLDLAEFTIAGFDALINKGKIAEVFACCELMACYQNTQKPEIYYWHREKRASNAEIDYLVALHGNIIPIEVKAGKKGQMQSMHLFLAEKGLARGIRISAENFACYDKILTLPLYAAGNVWRIPSTL